MTDKEYYHNADNASLDMKNYSVGEVCTYWDQQAPEEAFGKVVDYCINDVYPDLRNDIG